MPNPLVDRTQLLADDCDGLATVVVTLTSTNGMSLPMSLGQLSILMMDLVASDYPDLFLEMMEAALSRAPTSLPASPNKLWVNAGVVCLS